MIETCFDWVNDIAALLLCAGVVLALRELVGAYQRLAEQAGETSGAAFDPIDYAVDTLFKAVLQADLGPSGAGHNCIERGHWLSDHRNH